MIEVLVMFVGALPLLIGIYAIKIMRDNDNRSSNDPPPPPPPEPPAPVGPASPRRRHTPERPRQERDPVMRHTPCQRPDGRRAY
jgi:hypothetical protein